MTVLLHPYQERSKKLYEECGIQQMIRSANTCTFRCVFTSARASMCVFCMYVTSFNIV